MSSDMHKVSSILSVGAEPWPAGTRVGRYVLRGLLAAGGFGRVYRGEDSRGRLVAIKEYRPMFVQKPVGVSPERLERWFQEGLQMFYQEAQMASKIQHPNVVAVLDIVHELETAFLVMNYEHGQTMHSLRSKHPAYMHPQKVAELMCFAARGLAVLHEHGLLHLDLKPANLLVRPDESVVILDLGASRQLQADTESKSRARTQGFAAPEQSEPEYGPFSVQTDIYAFGATLWYLLTKKLPPDWEARRVNKKPIGSGLGMLWNYADQYPARWLSLIENCLQLEPWLRPTSIRQIEMELVRLFE